MEISKVRLVLAVFCNDFQRKKVLMGRLLEISEFNEGFNIAISMILPERLER